MLKIIKMLMGLLSGGGGQSQLMAALPGLLGASGGLGGLSGLMGMLEKAGAGDIGKSWVGSGENQQISPDMLKQALGADQLNKLAAEAGTSPDKAASGLSQLLPGVVDKLTPDGQLPSDDDVAGKLGNIPQLLGR